MPAFHATSEARGQLTGSAAAASRRNHLSRESQIVRSCLSFAGVTPVSPPTAERPAVGEHTSGLLLAGLAGDSDLNGLLSPCVLNLTHTGLAGDSNRPLQCPCHGASSSIERDSLSSGICVQSFCGVVALLARLWVSRLQLALQLAFAVSGLPRCLLCECDAFFWS